MTTKTIASVATDFMGRGEGEWPSLLQKHGWKKLKDDPKDGASIWKSAAGQGISATLGRVGPGLLYVISAEAKPFEQGDGYDIFLAYALLEHGGDEAAAAAELLKQGYGIAAEGADGTTRTTSAAEQPWEDLVPLDLPSVPEFPVEVFPYWLRRMCQAVSTATQTPIDAPAMQAMAVLGTAAAKRVEANAVPGWFEPLNVWTAVGLGPANLKSAVEGEMSRPIREQERFLVASMADEIAGARADREIEEARLKRLKGQLAKLDGGQEREALRDEVRYLEALIERMPKPIPPQLLAEDATVEALALLASEQAGRIAVLSAEGQVFSGMTGIYSAGATNIGFYLKAHCGDPVQVTRISRGKVCIERPALTLGLLIQPGVVRRLAERPEFRDQGLLARFLYAMPVSLLGKRDVRAEPVPDLVRRGYQEQVLRLLGMAAAEDKTGNPAAHHLLFTDEAVEEIHLFREALEPRLGAGGDLEHLGDWAGKLHGAVVRIAALLHLAQHSDKEKPWGARVEAETVQNAIKVGHYLIPHAIAAFGLMTDTEATAAAKAVLEWFKRKRDPHVKRRDLWRGMRQLKTQEALDAALDVLYSRGYIRHAATKKGSGPVYEVNPAVFGGVEE